MENKIHSVKYNFVMNFILTASQIIFPLITFPYVARVLLASGNGKVSFVASVTNYFVMVASLGIPTHGIRACAKVRDDKEKLSKTVHELFVINCVMTAIVVITFLLCVFYIPKFRAEKTLFLINGVGIVLNVFGMNWVYQALEQYDYITVRSIAFKILSIILMFLLVHQPSDYILYGGITVFAGVGSNTLNFIRLREIVSFKYIGDYNYKQHFKPISILFAQSLAVSVYTNLDTVMLGFLKEDVDVGYYHAAVKIKGLLLSLVTSLGNVLLPRMSYFVKKNMMTEFKKYMLKVMNFSTLMSLPLVLYFVLFAKETILFLAGDGYEGAIVAMQIITIAVIPNALTGVLGIQVLTPLEKEKYVLYSVLVGAVSDFVLNLIMIPLWGAAGASLATMIAEYLVLGVQVYFTRDLLYQVVKKLRIHIYFMIAILASAASIFIKLISFDYMVLKLLVSFAVFFGIYMLGLFISKENVVMDILDEIKRKIK